MTTSTNSPSVEKIEHALHLFVKADLYDALSDEIKQHVDTWTNAERVDLVEFILSNCDLYDRLSDHSNQDTCPYVKKSRAFRAFSNYISKRKTDFGARVTALLGLIYVELTRKPFSDKEYNSIRLYTITIPLLSAIVRNCTKEQRDAVPMLIKIKEHIERIESQFSFTNKQVEKLIVRMEELIFSLSATEDAIQPVYFSSEGVFENLANQQIDEQNEADKIRWFKLLALAQKASGSKPSKKFLTEATKAIDELGAEKFKKMLTGWFACIVELENFYANFKTQLLSPLTTDSVKGLVWMTTLYPDKEMMQWISNLAMRAYQKIPSVGAVSAVLGNACLYALFASESLEGIAQLTKLKLKIKTNSTLRLIEEYLDEAAQRMGMTTHEVEDFAVDNFNLVQHQLEETFGDYKAVLKLTGIGKSSLQWYKADGKEQKSVPQVVKDNFADELKRLKNNQKLIDQTTSVQKERFDRMLRANRVMTMAYFFEKYWQHPLLSFVLDKVIFRLSNEQTQTTALFLNNGWVDVNNQPVNTQFYTHITLWHPVTASTDEVKNWRQTLMDLKIQQPFKQAFREIYLLTDAERNTRTYSNRMASHILKQNQYATLARGRAWSTRLMGAWDGAAEDVAELYLPEYNLFAQYWVAAVEAPGQHNETGIWDYVSTDQIRFVNPESNEPIELVNVPPIAFSEVMRDLDLFVGVASVGNDPTWRDNGAMRDYQNYWQAYSFGDLSEIAKNRKEILQGLIPRLKIADVAHIADKFLVVKGKWRTYKIHIGSTNILMEPNDQYLCIVSDRSKLLDSDNLYLPFEGDTGLSLILSKAFLLAADDKITDETILSQIHR